MANSTLGYQIYGYTGVNKQGKIIKGMIPAENEQVAEHLVSALGLEINKLKAKPKGYSKKMLRKVPSADVVLFVRQLSTMVAAGIPLVQSLEIISNGLERLGMRALVMAINKDVSGGLTFTDALRRHPKIFTPIVCNLVYAGENSGTLDTILDHIATYLERIEVLKGRIKKALFYPVIMLVVTLGVGVLLLGFIVPQFEVLFRSFGADLPGPTRVIMNLSDFLINRWWLVIGVIAAIVSTFMLLKKKSPKFRFLFDKFQVNVILFGPLIRKSILSRISRTLAITLAAGIPLVEALKSVAAVCDNLVYSNAVLKVREEVIGGKPMYTSMMDTGVFPSMMLQMVGVGEKAGELESMLARLADFFEEQVNTMVDALSTLLEPVLLVLLGLVIGGFVVSMYLPIFRLGTVM